MLFDCGHPCLRNLNSAIIIDEEAIHIKLYPNNINRESGIKISEVWMTTVKKYNSQSVTKQTYEGITSAVGMIMRIEMHHGQSTTTYQ